MKTKRFISKLRATSEIAALFIFVLLALLILLYDIQATQEFVFHFWPIGVCVLVAYTILSLLEDYLNYRIFCKYPKLH